MATDSNRLCPSSSEKSADPLPATASTPHSSDGPTLPIIGAVGEHGTTIAVPAKTRLAHGKAMRDGNEENGRARKKQKTQHGGSKEVDLGPLYEPWTLLPPEILKLVERRLGDAASWKDRTIPIVFNRNQNIKAGVNRLKMLLGAHADGMAAIGQDVQDKLKREDASIAVSAQGEGTTKLVGILEVVKRVVAPPPAKEDDDASKNGKMAKWYMYTVLSSRILQGRAQSEARVDGQRDGEPPVDEEPDDGAFEPRPGRCLSNKRGDGEAADAKRRKIPVLTVWMSKRQIPGFKEAFGEQTYSLYAE